MLNQNLRMTEIITPNEFGTITEKEIKDFQEIIGFELPDDYSNFLKLYNGGKPKFDSLKIYKRKKEELWTFGYLFGIHDKEYWASIFWAINSLENKIPNEFLPIADNSGGDYYVMNLSINLSPLMLYPCFIHTSAIHHLYSNHILGKLTLM